MNCILYSGLVTKYNQISQNVDTTAELFNYNCPMEEISEDVGRLKIYKFNIFTIQLKQGIKLCVYIDDGFGAHSII